jgi:NAD(P)-dependent dehydrogenase (short-subunit alcohol dehydrogenase family)
MQQLQDKVAVITGAASGFGQELAIGCAREHMRLVLADSDDKGLQTAIDLLLPGTEVLAVKFDVSDADQVEELAVKTWQRFGAAHLLCNYADVAIGGPLWAATPQDWEQVLGINLMGVVYGIRSFVPRMLTQNAECHIVNTASVAGFVSIPGSGVYCASKHAVVTLSECLQQELEAENAPIGVSVLCPPLADAAIAPAHHDPGETQASVALVQPHEEPSRKAARAGRFNAADMARMTLDAVRNGRFYILPQPKIKAAIETRMRDILDERKPTRAAP